jgi:glycosyltransferase involved in cell wall biosynthesis
VKSFVLVIPSFAGGGAERVMIQLANEFDRRGRDVHLLVVDARGPLRELPRGGVAVHDLGRRRVLTAAWDIVRCVRSVGAPHVLGTMAHVNLILLAMRGLMRKGTRVYVREANTPSVNIRLQSWPALFRMGYRYLYPRANYILCPSTLIVTELTAEFGVSAASTLRVDNPVDEERIRASLVPKRMPGAGMRIVAAGRLSEQKGFDRLIDWLARWEFDAQLDIFGEGEDRSALQTLINKHGMTKRVRLRGFTDELSGWLAGADAFVLPSRWEGMPNVALEALACGTSVVGMDAAGGLAELAQLAPESVHIANDGRQMGIALGEIAVHAPGGCPRPSLLPQRFRLETAAETLLRALEMAA